MLTATALPLTAGAKIERRGLDAAQRCERARSATPPRGEAKYSAALPRLPRGGEQSRPRSREAGEAGGTGEPGKELTARAKAARATEQGARRQPETGTQDCTGASDHGARKRAHGRKL